MITRTGELAELIERIAAHPRIAVDTEADSLHSYFEKLCLIQVSIPGQDVLIDPLVELPLKPLFDLLETRTIIFHGADYDLRMLRRSGGFQARKIFDTMIAARLVGLDAFSLAALLERYFGVIVPKGSQKANWGRRPLSEKMIAYAMNDTRYLLPLAEKLEHQLRELGRWEWFGQSCDRAIAQAATTRERDIELAWRITGSSDLRDRASALLRALWLWRDEEARNVDRPAFYILRNEELIEFARRFDKGDPVHPAHLNGGRRKRFFLAADAALALPEDQWPREIRQRRSRPTPEHERRLREHKERRDKAAVALGLDPALIAPKATLEAIAAEPEAAGLRLLPWQRELLEL